MGHLVEQNLTVRKNMNLKVAKCGWSNYMDLQMSTNHILVVVAQFTERSLRPPEVCGSYPVELKFEKNIFDKLSQNSLTSNFQRLKFLEIELL